MRLAGLVCVLATMCLTVVPGYAQAPERDVATMRDLAADLANSYLRIWSAGDGPALNDVYEVYAPRVNFYGRILDRRGITAEKLRFVHRWPIRRYRLLPGTTRVDCDQTRRSCLVRTLIDWDAASPQRHAVSRGVSEFKLGIGFDGARPVVVYEGGRVVGRGRS